jgi:hypothetical protein
MFFSAFSLRSPTVRLSTIRLSHHSPITRFAYWGEFYDLPIGAKATICLLGQKPRFAYWGQKHDSPIPGYKGIKVDLRRLNRIKAWNRWEMARRASGRSGKALRVRGIYLDKGGLRWIWGLRAKMMGLRREMGRK